MNYTTLILPLVKVLGRADGITKVTEQIDSALSNSLSLIVDRSSNMPAKPVKHNRIYPEN